MKRKTYEDDIRKAVSRALGHYGITFDDVEMPSYASVMVSVLFCKDRSSTWRKIPLAIPNDVLAEMIHGDNWDGDASDGAFRFGGGGYDLVWFECGVVEG